MNKEALLNEIEKEAFSEEFEKLAVGAVFMNQRVDDYSPVGQENTPNGIEQINASGARGDGSSAKENGFLKGFLGKATNAYEAIKKIPVDYKANKAESKSAISSLTGSIGNAWKGSPDLRHMTYGTGATLAAAGIGTYLMNRRRKNNNAQVVINN